MPQTVTNYIPFRYKAFFPHNNPMLLDGEQVPNAAFNILEVNSLYVKSGTSGALQIPIFEQDAVTPYLWDGPTDNAASDLNVFLGHYAATGPGLVLTNNTIVGNRNTLPTGSASVIMMGYQNTGSVSATILGNGNVSVGTANVLVGTTNVATGTTNFVVGVSNNVFGVSSLATTGSSSATTGSSSSTTGSSTDIITSSSSTTGSSSTTATKNQIKPPIIKLKMISIVPINGVYLTFDLCNRKFWADSIYIKRAQI